MSATTKVVKEGTNDISEIFKAVIDLGKDGIIYVFYEVSDIMWAKRWDEWQVNLEKSL